MAFEPEAKLFSDMMSALRAWQRKSREHHGLEINRSVPQIGKTPPALRYLAGGIRIGVYTSHAGLWQASISMSSAPIRMKNSMDDPQLTGSFRWHFPKTHWRVFSRRQAPAADPTLSMISLS